MDELFYSIVLGFYALFYSIVLGFYALFYSIVLGFYALFYSVVLGFYAFSQMKPIQDAYPWPTSFLKALTLLSPLWSSIKKKIVLTLTINKLGKISDRRTTLKFVMPFVCVVRTKKLSSTEVKCNLT